MPSQLSERPEELIRQWLTDNIRPGNIQGYDPTLTDETDSAWMPVTSSWNKFGDTYPKIVVTESNSPTVPNSGNTGFNGLQSDGSGPNAYTIPNITLSCQAVELEDSSAYLNGVAADDLAYQLYQECHDLLQNNVISAINEALYTSLTPPDGTQTRNSEETDSGSTLNWIQRQGQVQMGYINEP